MSWSCAIKIVDDDGDAVEGARVLIIGWGFTGGTISEYTDDDGWAEFELDPWNKDSFHAASISVDGDEVCGEISIDDGETLSFTV
jgi:hypothetical protein